MPVCPLGLTKLTLLDCKQDYEHSYERACPFLTALGAAIQPAVLLCGKQIQCRACHYMRAKPASLRHEVVSLLHIMLQGDPSSVGQHLSHMKLAGDNQHVAVAAEELQRASFLQRGLELWITTQPLRFLF